MNMNECSICMSKATELVILWVRFSLKYTSARAEAAVFFWILVLFISERCNLFNIIHLQQYFVIFSASELGAIIS